MKTLRFLVIGVWAAAACACSRPADEAAAPASAPAAIGRRVTESAAPAPRLPKLRRSRPTSWLAWCEHIHPCSGAPMRP